MDSCYRSDGARPLMTLVFLLLRYRNNAMRSNLCVDCGEDYRRYFLLLDDVGIAILSKPVITPAPMDANSLATAVPIDAASLETHVQSSFCSPCFPPSSVGR